MCSRFQDAEERAPYTTMQKTCQEDLAKNRRSCFQQRKIARQNDLSLSTTAVATVLVKSAGKILFVLIDFMSIYS